MTAWHSDGCWQRDGVGESARSGHDARAIRPWSKVHSCGPGGKHQCFLRPPRPKSRTLSVLDTRVPMEALIFWARIQWAVLSVDGEFTASVLSVDIFNAERSHPGFTLAIAVLTLTHPFAVKSTTIPTSRGTDFW